MNKVAISIVEYNTSNLLKGCLGSLLDQKWGNDVEVWVVDNASNDDSLEMVKREFPGVHLIESSKNLGFGGGHNLVLKKVPADYYLILNSDTELGDGVVDGMVEFMERNPDCGITSCKVVGFDGKLQPNGGDLPFGWALFSWLFNLESVGIKTSFHRNDKKYYDFAHKVGWVSGNFMMVKRKVFDKIGYFNENYFMYFEDVDFCYRAEKAGFSVMINPGVNIKHLSGGSLDDPKFRQWSGEMIGLVKFYRQQFGKPVGFLVKIMVYVSLFLRLIAFAIIGKLSYSYYYAKVIVKI